MEVDSNGQVRIERYWDLAVVKDERSHPESYYIHTYRDMLEHAVGSHLMSDVPLGVFLSGGVDSSSAAALIAKKRTATRHNFLAKHPQKTSNALSTAPRVANNSPSRHTIP